MPIEAKPFPLKALSRHAFLEFLWFPEYHLVYLELQPFYLPSHPLMSRFDILFLIPYPLLFFQKGGFAPLNPPYDFFLSPISFWQRRRLLRIPSFLSGGAKQRAFLI